MGKIQLVSMQNKQTPWLMIENLPEPLLKCVITLVYEELPMVQARGSRAGLGVLPVGKPSHPLWLPAVLVAGCYTYELQCERHHGTCRPQPLSVRSLPAESADVAAPGEEGMVRLFCAELQCAF